MGVAIIPSECGLFKVGMLHVKVSVVHRKAIKKNSLFLGNL